jgi:glycosyltransferase involved in cell wall biosynthesis
MRILQVNKFNYLKGGSEKYFLELAELLTENGHVVAKFAMQNPLNLKDEHDQYFVSQVDFNGGTIWNKLRAAGRIIWSFEAARKFESLIQDFQPEVIHIHNIYHQISPSILRVARKYRVPVVMHLHDYKLVCPNMKMYNSTGICERCKGGGFYHCAAGKCLKNSYAKSLLASLEMYLHHRILKIYQKTIVIFIAPSAFLAKKMIEWGVAEDKIVVLPYFIKTDDYIPNYQPGDYLLFYGRLAREKGILTLLRAYKSLNINALPLKIVGAGAEFAELKAEIEHLGLENKVVLLGPKYGETLKQLVAQSYAVIVPSEWYEVSGLVNLEASLLGKPVIASRIGGITEVVGHQETGLLFPAGNEAKLAESLRLILSDEVLAEELGRAGHRYIMTNFSKKSHLVKILALYKKAIRANQH